MNCSPPGSSVHGILQARILEWVAIPFSWGLNPDVLYCRQILYHLSPHSAVKYATCAAAISVTRLGASTSIPSLEEVVAYAKNKVAQENGEAADGSGEGDA